jgi:hypothetical protein
MGPFFWKLLDLKATERLRTLPTGIRVVGSPYDPDDLRRIIPPLQAPTPEHHRSLAFVYRRLDVRRSALR